METVNEKINELLEYLYEVDNAKKIEGTKKIMILSKSPENLAVMSENGTLLGALSRVMKEEMRNSMDLMANILYVFYSFSHYPELHEKICQYHISSIVLKVLDFEQKRFIEMSKALKEDNADTKKITILVQKQETLLSICIHILLNLAENPATELKIKKKHIIPLLIELLDRENLDLLCATVDLQKKLSVEQENKQEMLQLQIFPKLKKLLILPDSQLLFSVLSLLFELSTEKKVREDMVEIIPILVELMKSEVTLEICIKLLYQASFEEKCRIMISKTPAIPMLTELIVEYPEALLNKELIALAINLTTYQENAQQFCAGNSPQRFVERLFKYKDPLLGKMLRNMVQFEDCKATFKPHIQNLVSTMLQSNASPLLPDIIGIVAQLISFADYDFTTIALQYNLPDFLQRQLIPGYADDEIVYEVIGMVGSFLSSIEMSDIILSNSQIFNQIFDLFPKKLYKDNKMILQMLYVFYKMSLFEQTRKELLMKETVVIQIVHLINFEDFQISSVADKIIDIAMDVDSSWFEILRAEKFKIHNFQWLKAIEEEEMAMMARVAAQNAQSNASSFEYSPNSSPDDEDRIRDSNHFNDDENTRSDEDEDGSDDSSSQTPGIANYSFVDDENMPINNWAMDEDEDEDAENDV